MYSLAHPSNLFEQRSKEPFDRNERRSLFDHFQDVSGRWSRIQLGFNDSFHSFEVGFRVGKLLDSYPLTEIPDTT